MAVYVEDQRSGTSGHPVHHIHGGIPTRWIDRCFGKGSADCLQIESRTHG
jgi:hypothetical protein